MAMRRPPRPQPLAVSTAINTTSNPFASVLNENDPASEKRITVEDIIDDVVVSDDDDDSYTESRGGRQKPPRPSMAATARMTALTASAKRRRRRSSARFLQLGGSSRRLSSRRGSMGGGDNDDDDTNNEASNTQSEGNLSELYQKAIRMNAENKINAVNSWNLRLIENIDMFLEGDDESDEEMQTPSNAANSTDAVVPMSTNNKRVNFTKASCTLDASVKIYSYRVDDVHLTSYKVLANLNRTDTQKPNKNNNADFPEDNGDDAGPTEKRSSNKSSGSTLETHLGTYGNLRVHV
jgi:Condensin complex subunit 2